MTMVDKNSVRAGSADIGNIDAQLERIVAHESFVQSGRLQSLLTHIVRESLAGRTENLLGKNIAKDVFGHTDQASAEDMSTVRVEVGRLRRRLNEYYAGCGADDPIRISIPKGGYIAVFTAATDAPELPEKSGAGSQERQTGTGERRRWVVVAMAMSVVILVALGGILWLSSNGGPDNQPVSRTTDPSQPFIVVMPLSGVGNSKITAKLATGYMEAVIANLTNLSGLSVMAARSSVGFAEEAIPLQALRDNQGVSHVLSGSFITQGENVRVSVHLIDTKTAEAVWAERFEGDLNNLFELEDRLANRIATALSVTVDPDESRRIYLRHTSNRKAMEFVRHATVAINPPNERARIESARALHQRVIELDPNFAGGHAGLSQVHSYMVLFRHSEKPEDDLKSAIAYAKKAIELDDSFGTGHSMLGLAYSLAGKTDLALSQVRRAVALQPGDPLAHQWFGGVMILSGRPDEAVPAMLEAIRLDPIEPGTPYLNILGMAYFNLEQYDRAIEAFERNREKGGPDAPNMEAYRAATYAMLGRETEAREVIANLNVRPGEISPENWIRSWTPSPQLAKKAIAALHRLGMKNRDQAASGKSPSIGTASTTQ